METCSSPNLECRMYPAELPSKGEYVMTRVRSQSRSGDFVVELLEYNKLEASLSKMNTKKTSVGRFEPLKITIVNEEKKEIDVTQINLGENDVKGCEERFAKSKTVHSVMRALALTTKTDLEDLYNLFCWDLHKEFRDAYTAFQKIMQNIYLNLGSILEKGIPVLNRAIEACKKEIESQGGNMVVVKPPKGPEMDRN